MLKKEMTKRQLISAYKELDKVVGIDPPIEYEDLSMEVFAKELHETADELVEPGDEFTEQTQGIFNQLKEQIEGGVEEPKEPKEPEEQVDEAEEVDKSEEEPKEQYADEKEEEEPKKEPAKTKKIKHNTSYPKRVAMFDAITNNKSITLDQWANKMNDLYVEKGGADNLHGTKVFIQLTIPVLVMFGAVKQNGKGKDAKFSLPE